MTAVLNIVFAMVAGVAILAALYYGGRAIIRRGRPTESAYNVGRQQARRDVQIDLIRALAMIVVALIFLGAFGLTPRPVEPLISPTEPVQVQDDATQSPTEIPTEATTPIPPTLTVIESTPLEPSPFPTTQPTAEPTDTAEPAAQTAVVSSGVGVWLRAAPGTAGEQLEWLLDGTVLTLLNGQETADDLQWQQVQTEAGTIGWVAADFLVTTEQP